MNAVTRTLMNTLRSMGPIATSVQLSVAIPEGVRFVAQDADGTWWGYPDRPIFEDQTTWNPDGRGLGTCCLLCHGVPNRNAIASLEQVRR